MGYISDESRALFSELQRQGYKKEFAYLVSTELRTPWTANRMLGYLRNMPRVSEEEIVDEMLSILSHRDQIREKKEMEFYQSKINEMYRYGLGVEEDEDE